MLETIRKRQKSLMIIVATIIIIAFVFFYNQFDPSRSTSARIGTKVLSINQIRKYHRLKLLMRKMGLGSYAQQWEILPTQYIIRDNPNRSNAFVRSLITVRDMANKYGIYSSDEETGKLLGKLFAPKDSLESHAEITKATQEAYTKFIKEVATPAGFTESSIKEIAKDCLAYEKLRRLVAPSISIPSSLVSEAVNRTNLDIKGKQILFVPTDVSNSIEVTDKEVSDFYEKNKSSLNTAEKYEINYVKVNTPAPSQSKTPIPETIKNLTQEEQKQEKIKEEQEKEANKLLAIASRKKIEQIYISLKTSNVSFQKAAEKENVKIHSTGTFSSIDLPEDLKSAQTLIKELQNIEPSEKRRFTPPVRTSYGYIIAELKKVIPSRPMTLEEAKDRIQSKLINQKTATAMEIHSKEQHSKLSELLQKGKSIEEATNELNLSLQELPEEKFINFLPAGHPINERFIRLANQPENTLSAPQNDPLGIRLVYIESKTKKNPAEVSQEEIEKTATRLSQTYAHTLFIGWFTEAFSRINQEITGIRQ